MRRFADASIVVTGASRGLGRAIAVGFAREGGRVGIGYRSRETEALKTLALVEAAGGTGSLLPFDVRDGAAVSASVASFVGEGALDVFVNNAAVVSDEFFALLGEGKWEQVIATNLGGTYHGCRAALESMMRRRRGSIVNIASVAGLRASPGQANYAASKGGVLALTSTLAAELAPRGVRVNAVIPGFLSTGMGERLDHRFVERQVARVPLRRFGEADEVVRAVLFLASDDASYIVGHCLVVDGGLSL